jgi:hypothetical protein
MDWFARLIGFRATDPASVRERLVEIELSTRPRVKRLTAFEPDCGTQDLGLRIKLRAARAGYMLRWWSADACAARHPEPSSTYRSWLRNAPTGYRWESAAIARGEVWSGEAGCALESSEIER